MPFNKVQLLAVYLLSDVLNLYFWIAPSVMEKGWRQSKRKRLFHLFSSCRKLPLCCWNPPGTCAFNKTTCPMRQSGWRILETNLKEKKRSGLSYFLDKDSNKIANSLWSTFQRVLLSLGMPQRDSGASWKIFWFRTITVLLYFSWVSLLFLLCHEKSQGFTWMKPSAPVA